MKFIPIILAIVCSVHSFAHANLRGIFDDGDTDRVQQRDRGNSKKQPPPPPQYVPGQFLVKFKPGVSEMNCGQAMAASLSMVSEKILTAAMRGNGDAEGVTVMTTGVAVPEAVEAMIASGMVEYAEPNYIYRHDAVSNDTYVTNGNLWGMTGAFGIGAATAWQNDKTDCSSVYVGIIDEGVNFAHVDLAANAGNSPREAENGLDEDGNNYIDDVYGWDFVNNDKTVYDGGTEDKHGTHVAGTIGGVGGNGIGVAGVCWKVKLLSAKFLGPNGGTTLNAIKAVDYFTGLKKKGLNIVATNNSWGGGGYSQALYDAIQRANVEGILFVAAAGNSAANNDNTASYPSNYNSANVIAVASITSTGALSSFSSYGATTVDIGAPGSGIYSTLPGNSYGSYSGTSMATPHVTGAVALYKALNPSATAAETKAAILAAAIQTPSLAGKVVTGGRLSVAGFATPTSPTTSSPSKAPSPTSSPTTKAPTTTAPTKAPTQTPPSTCRAKFQSCNKSNCASSSCGGIGTTCCCCNGLTCRNSGTCR